MPDRGRETKPNRSNCSRDDDYTPKEIKYDSTSSITIEYIGNN